MNGWIVNGWRDGWMDNGVDRWLGGRVDEQVVGWIIDGWIVG